MKISWVLPDGERNRRFNKLIKNGIRNNQRQDITPGRKKSFVLFLFIFLVGDRWHFDTEFKLFVKWSGCSIFLNTRTLKSFLESIHYNLVPKIMPHIGGQ